MRRSLALVPLCGCIPHLYSSGNGDSEPTEWTLPKNSWKQCGTPSPYFYDEPTGYDVGELFPDARIEDQNGDIVSMWQFTGCVTVVDLSTSWCAPCQKLATGVDEMYAKYDADGLAYVTLLSQDGNNNDTDRQDLIDWSERFGVTTTPILADHKYTWEILEIVAFPRVLLLDREMRVINGNVGQTHDVIEAAVEKAL
jgi:thiol-disulfide isomerase/thioredoxin